MANALERSLATGPCYHHAFVTVFLKSGTEIVGSALELKGKSADRPTKEQQAIIDERIEFLAIDMCCFFSTMNQLEELQRRL